MIKPVATNFKEEQAARGNGQFRDSIELLQQDQKAYYYQKFIDEQNQYLNDDIWTEAAKRGELDQLIFLLDKNKGTNQYVDKLNSYGVEYTYDDYMNALAIPQLDDTTKTDRIIDGYNFGSYTNKEWAEKVLQRTFEGLEAQIIESNKENLNFFEKFKGYTVSGLSRLASGVLNFGQDIANVGEGILNIFANYSNDETIGNRFLWAFSDESDESVGDTADMFRLIAYDYERKYTTIVDANKAFEEGFSLNGVNLGLDNYYDAAKKVQGVNAGIDGWGKYWVNGIEAIGYMLPAMLIPGGKATSTTAKGLGSISKVATTAGKVLTASKPILFHTGIFGGMISETVEYAKFNGISYKDLNSGEVIANAAIKTAAQFAIEKALGAILGFSPLDKMMGIGTARATTKAFSSIGKAGVKALPNVVGRFAKDAIKEGFEESLQDLSDSLINYAFGGIYKDYTKQNFSIQNIADSFVIGALTSGVISSIANASVLLPSNRSVAIDEKGNYYRLGVFQQLNYNQALQAMNEWNAILQDEKASNQKKADAAFKMNIAIDTIGNVLRIMGSDRAIQANTLLVELSKSEDIETKSKAILELHNIDYANNLYNKFIQQSAIANLKYLSTEKKSKIKQAIDSVVSKFKKAKVTELSNVITEEIPNSEIDQNSGIGKLKAELKKFGVDLIVAVDGEIVTKSKDVLFVNNKLVEKGDITEIIKGASYDAVVSAVSKKLSRTQIKMLAQQYEKITGNVGDIEDVITALLFDKNFYTYSLLLSTERRYENKAIETLITLDQVIKEASTKDTKGNIIDKAQLALLNKVRETLRNGLVVYCTQYVNLDLSKISKEILPKELIKTIEDNANVRFTTFINEAVQDVALSNKTVEESRLRRAEQYDAVIDRFASEIPLIKSISEILKQKARSNKLNDRVDAYTTLIALCKSEYGPSRKLVYLPSSNMGIFEINQINDIETFMGVSISEFLADNFDSSLLSEEFTNLIVSSQTDISTSFSRRLALRELLFTRSNGTLTIGSNGSILKVITSENFLSKKFDKAENIDEAILDGIANLSIQKVQDLTDIKLPKEIGDIPISVNPRLSGNGIYSVSSNEIIIKGVKTVNTLMHEITHATQMLSAIGANDNVVLGTSNAVLNVLPDKVFNDLTSYIEKTFPNSYNVIRSLNENPEMAIYFMVSGELEANSMFINQMYELGFTWSNNKTELISPDGKRRWSMRPDINKRLKYVIELAKNKAIEEDVPLIDSAVQKLRDDKEIMSFVKDSMFKDGNGIPFVFYRGSSSEERQNLGKRKDGTIYLSSKPYVARFFATYDRHDIGPFRGYIINLKPEEVLTIDGKNSYWSTIEFNNKIMSTDDIVRYVKENYPNYKAVYIKQVKEVPNEMDLAFGDDLILLKDINNSLKRITKEDRGEFLETYTEYIFYDLRPQNEEIFNDFVYAYIASYPNVTDTDFLEKVNEIRSVSKFIKQPELKIKLLTNYFKDNRYREVSKKMINNIRDIHKTLIETGFKNMESLFNKAKTDFANELANMEDLPFDTKNLKDISKEKESKLVKKKKEYFKSRYISNKIAKDSNLKHFIKKGRPILMHENLKNFIISTTSDFDKLAKPLQEKIKNGSLTLFDIYDFITTTNYIDDYTFKAIAKYVYNNENLSKVTYADMKKVLENIEFLAVSSYLLRETGVDNLTLSIDELFQMSENVQNSLKNSKDVKLKKQYEKAYVLAQSVRTNSGQRVEVSGDPMQMQSIFFRHFDGSLDSIVDINNLGKYMALQQKPQELIENVDTGTVESKGGTGNWNWIDNMKVAETNYYPERFESISRTEKEDVVINYLTEVIIEKLNKLPEVDRLKMAKAAKAKLEEESEKVRQSSNEVLNKKYLFVINTEFFKKDRYKLSNALVSEVSKKTIKDTIRNTGRTITKRIAGLKNNYKLLSDKAKEYFDPVTYKLNDKYQSLSESELTELNSILSDDLKKLTKAVGSTKTLLKVQETTSKRLSKVESKLAKEKEKTAKVESKLAKEKEKTAKLREQVKTLKESPNVKNGKTIREKILTKYKTVIKEQSFELTSNVKPNEVANSVLNTSWNKTRMSAVKGVDSNTEVTIANGKIFFEENAETLMNATTAELEEAAEWFLNSNLNNATDEDYEKFKAVKMYYLGYLFTDVTAISPELHKRIDNWLRRTQTVSGKMLSIWKNIRTKISPLDILKNQDIEIDGVSLTEGEKDRLFKAVEEGNLDALNENMTKIINRIADANKNKSSRIRKIIAIRAMSMLSSPMTWLRNIASNIVLKRLYNISDIIGQKVFSSKTIDNQILLKAKVTPEISDFINTHFIDNGLFETLVSNLSKYSSSDIRNDKPKALKDKPLTKEEVFSRMVLKSMYNKYYNENLFKSKVIKTIHEKIMNYMSDNNYIREASIKYLGKRMAEKGYDLSKGVTNEIVSDFGNAVGLAMNDYMHSNNVFNEVEKYIAKKGEGWLFVYKAILPFAATSYQWFKASIKTSPIGLINAIRKMTRLEQNVKKMEENWRSGKSDIPPELAEYFIRREFGQGVIGTIFWGAGLIAAALGFIKLEDDDYGIPKLKFGKLEVDVSSLFGSSSFLAGAAFVTAFTDKYDEDANFWTKLKEGLDRGVDVIVDGFPMMQIVEMDMYERGGFSIGLNNLESYALSFIPNFLSWIAGATYSGELRKNTFLGKAAAKIPFLGPVFNEYKINPYTGKRGTWLDALNRVIPYFSWDSASQIEEKSKALGLNKTELKSKYKINGKSFEVTKEDLTKINEAYGSWNVEDLTKFYDNKLKVTIKVGDTYKSLSYSEMNSKQQKRAVEQLMEKNAKYAKILAWTMNGNKYQASNNEYLELLRRGIKTNVYRGTKGFIENQK